MKRYLMLLQVYGYHVGKRRIYYCASIKGLQYNLERFFNSIIDGYDWHWNDEEGEIDYNDVKEIYYPYDMPMNYWVNKKLEQIDDFRRYLDGAGASLDVYSIDADVEELIYNLLDYFDIDLTDKSADQDTEANANTIKELLDPQKCKKAITQINKWLAR